MKKNKGFVFIETIVVVSVLSLTLLLLFSSYSYILRKSRERDAFETTETIYKTYYTKSIIDSLKSETNPESGVKQYINKHLGTECKKMGTYNSYVCVPKEDGDLHQVIKAFEVEKFYLVNPAELYRSSEHDDWLFLFDATTIDYLRELGGAQEVDLLIVKYKKTFNKNDGNYEIIHSSLEVRK